MAKIGVLLALFIGQAYAQLQGEYDLKFNSAALENSTMVTVAGQQVPLKVVTEIQNICDKKQMSKEECEKLIEQGCVEFTRVFTDPNVRVIDVPVLINLKLHVHEREHVIHQTQKRYTYHYEVEVTKSFEQTHEYQELPPVHGPATFGPSFDQNKVPQPQGFGPRKTENFGPAFNPNQKDIGPKAFKYAPAPSCPVGAPKGYNPKNSFQKFTPKTPSAPVVNVYQFWLPGCSQLSFDIARFIAARRLNCAVYNHGNWLEFRGVEARRIGWIIVKHLPNQQMFMQANQFQIRNLFNELEYYY